MRVLFVLMGLSSLNAGEKFLLFNAQKPSEAPKFINDGYVDKELAQVPLIRSPSQPFSPSKPTEIREIDADEAEDYADIEE